VDVVNQADDRLSLPHRRKVGDAIFDINDEVDVL
jgi:hypothetical protein